MTRILLISGSTRDGSLHSAALRTAARFAPAGITTTVYDGLRTLPAFVPGEPLPFQLRHQVADADAVLFCTPQYAGSLPGSLKNLLDWLADAGTLTDRPAAWLSVAAAGQDDGACQTLETVLAHAGARLLRSACIRIPLTVADVRGGVVVDPRAQVAVVDVMQALNRGMTVPQPRTVPAWQAVSSMYPMVLPRPDRPPYQNWRSET